MIGPVPGSGLHLERLLDPVPGNSQEQGLPAVLAPPSLHTRFQCSYPQSCLHEPLWMLVHVEPSRDGEIRPVRAEMLDPTLPQAEDSVSVERAGSCASALLNDPAPVYYAWLDTRANMKQHAKSGSLARVMRGLK